MITVTVTAHVCTIARTQPQTVAPPDLHTVLRKKWYILDNFVQLFESGKAKDLDRALCFAHLRCIQCHLVDLTSALDTPTISCLKGAKRRALVMSSLSPTFAFACPDLDDLLAPRPLWSLLCGVVLLAAGLGGRAVPPPRGGGGRNGRNGHAVGDVAEDAVGPRDGDRDAAARNTWKGHEFRQFV